MITSNQINALTEEELGYLVICCNTEWDNLKMGYPMKVNFIKSFKEQAIVFVLNKYKSALKEEHQNIIDTIINKLNANK